MKKLRPAVFLVVVSALGMWALYGTPRVDLSISRTFDRPVQFQIRCALGSVTLRTIIHSGAGGYDRGAVVRDDKRKLTSEEAKSLRSALSSALASSPKPARLFDGSTWSLRAGFFGARQMEVRSPGYKSSERDTQALYDCGRLLWRFSKVDEPDDAI
jgi:hypothetical protein